VSIDGGAAITTQSARYIDWVQVRVGAGTRLRVDARLYASGHVLDSTYRLHVVGSTGYFATTDIRGDHLRVPR
jgi:hypothetical protein